MKGLEQNCIIVRYTLEGHSSTMAVIVGREKVQEMVRDHAVKVREGAGDENVQKMVR